MLINYRFKNFKNFRDEVNLSFESGRKRELDEHIIDLDNEHKLLPLKVIYGSNASGKTNIIKSLNTLRRMILDSRLKNGEENYLLLCSNFSSLEMYESPIEFDITFFTDNIVYEYLVVIQNDFISKNSVVLRECLKEDGELIFDRNGNNVTFSKNPDVVKKHYPQFMDKNFSKQFLKMINTNIDSKDVFTSWYSMIDGDLCLSLMQYFKRQLIVISDLENYKLNIPRDFGEGTFTNKCISALMNELDAGQQEFYIEVDSDGKSSERVIYSLGEDCMVNAPAQSTESKGTIKMIDILEPLLYVLESGSTILIDELDASIHHEIIYNIIQAFGDKTINRLGAQLLFTTHDPVYMNKDLLRRDEIVFVEKENGRSLISTLDDYNLRNDEVYLKNYLVGKYTILPKFDISKILDVKNQVGK